MNDAIRAAAREISVLINTRPQSPRIDELEAIIARAAVPLLDCAPALGSVTPALAAAFAEWESVRVHYEAAGDTCGRTNDKGVRADTQHWVDLFGEKSEAVLALGAQTFADLQLLLPVVIYWNSPLSVNSPDYPHCTLETGGHDEGECLEPKSLAYFVRATMGLLGKPQSPVRRSVHDPAFTPPSREAMRQRLLEVDAMYAATGNDDDKIDAADAACNELSKAAHRIWATPATSIEDLKLRAEIAHYWHSMVAHNWKVPSDTGEWPDECVAHLILAVLNFPSRQ